MFVFVFVFVYVFLSSQSVRDSVCQYHVAIHAYPRVVRDGMSEELTPEGYFVKDTAAEEDQLINNQLIKDLFAIHPEWSLINGESNKQCYDGRSTLYTALPLPLTGVKDAITLTPQASVKIVRQFRQQGDVDNDSNITLPTDFQVSHP